MKRWESDGRRIRAPELKLRRKEIASEITFAIEKDGFADALKLEPARLPNKTDRTRMENDDNATTGFGVRDQPDQSSLGTGRVRL
ncbi:MAG: hypothetical protein D6743_20020, partial [Calditrichaeota bacterium]